MKYFVLCLIMMSVACAKDKTEKKEHSETKNIDGKLFKLDKSEVKTVKNKEYIAYYYSASWCPPCVKLTPSIVSFYNKSKAKDKFEIVLVSYDRNENALKKYMKAKKMTFPAIVFSKIKESTVTKYSGRGIPHMAIIKNDGTVVFKGYGPDGLKKLKSLVE